MLLRSRMWWKGRQQAHDFAERMGCQTRHCLRDGICHPSPCLALRFIPRPHISHYFLTTPCTGRPARTASPVFLQGQSPGHNQARQPAAGTLPGRRRRPVSPRLRPPRQRRAARAQACTPGAARGRRPLAPHRQPWEAQVGLFARPVGGAGHQPSPTLSCMPAIVPS